MPQERTISMFTDGAVVLHVSGSDAFGIMAVEAGTWNQEDAPLKHYDACVLATAITALTMKQCIRKEKAYRSQ